MKITVLLIVPLLLIGLAWGQDCTADDGTEGVELWGECYSIENTTEILLPSSGLTGEIPESIGYFLFLNSLVLYNNQLIGEIPESIGNLTNLSWLNLYNNQLTGEIPQNIGELTNLTSLDLGFNQFAGEIPASIGNLADLNHLWLYNNQLNGEIPVSICNVYQNLEHFYIYNNQFCPPYPECLTEEDIGYQDTTNCLGSVTVDYLSDWNLVGLPMEVEDPYYLTLFSDAMENTLFSFDDAYVLGTILVEGEGYWLRFESHGNTTITGNTINELTITLNEGWNLISGISTPLIISNMQDPDGIIISGTVYEFTSSGYFNTENIEPGKGYWLRANISGNIILISE